MNSYCDKKKRSCSTFKVCFEMVIIRGSQILRLAVLKTASPLLFFKKNPKNKQVQKYIITVTQPVKPRTPDVGIF